ncbi:MAG: acyl carrier protein [Deltaproteobacteria bacterium]|nr:acyl carrier protein [Deltaproteobacteria bacterium]
MTKKELVQMLEEIVEADPDTLTGEELIEDLEGWDSLAVVNFIALVDENFGITLSPEKIMNSKTVNELVSLLDGYIK